MTKDVQTVAIIPARGGSVGIPRKNVRELCGKPLIYWTIAAAKQSDRVTRLIVSTDDDEIAAAARRYGAEVPFMRPPELATSDAKAVDVWHHALNWLREHGEPAEESVWLHPTSPLREPRDINTAVDLLREKKADSVVSVCECEHPPLYANTLPEDLCMRDFIREDIKNANRQELPVYYRLNGSVYVIDVEYFSRSGYIIGENTYAYIMPKTRSVDIDDEIDFLLAETILRKNSVQGG